MANQRKDIRVASGGPLAPGEIQFYEAIQPPLTGGSYEIAVTQQIQLKAENPSYTLTQAFTIGGPRFRLSADVVQQVYPPANLTGSYEEDLPHVVLRQRTLPWSRTIDGSVPVDGGVPTPWLALLTLYPSELTDSSANPIVPTQLSLSQLLMPGSSNILGPAIDPAGFTADELAAQLLAIDLPSDIFLAIAPSLADLPFLAHGRQVNTDGKEILGLDEDGFFSVVVGNRLPLNGSLNTVLLVSLEGHQAHLPAASSIAVPGESIRLAVLASWTFTAAPAIGDFIEIMQALPNRGGVGLLGMPHNPYTGSQDAPATVAQQALETGYVPLLNNLRSGEETTSWYRGPASPVPTNADPNGPYLFSDRAIRYDPGPDPSNGASASSGTGLYDVSYACAWQIGRLLALSDSAFAQRLFDWRRSLAQKQNQQQAMSEFAAHMPLAAGAPKSAPLLEAKPEHLHTGIAAFLHEMAGAVKKPELPKVVPHENRSDHLLPGVLRKQQLSAAIDSGEDPLFALLRGAFGTPGGAAEDEKLGER